MLNYFELNGSTALEASSFEYLHTQQLTVEHTFARCTSSSGICLESGIDNYQHTYDPNRLL